MDDFTQDHECIFDDDDEVCLLCGAAAPMVDPKEGWSGTDDSEANEQVEKMKQGAKALLSQVPMSRADWKHKPHHARLICMCCVTLLFIVLLLLFVALLGGIDSNECSSSSSNECSVRATCTNLDGTYTCDCISGWIGDGMQCSDVDECSAAQMSRPEYAAAAWTAPRCHANAQCTNTAGAFTCACDKGYAGDGVSCADVLECAVSNGGCGNARHTRCIERLGGPPACTDVMECAANNGGCGAAARVKCTERKAAPPRCVDVDECALKNGGCASGYRCVNTYGAQQRCEDVDECAAGAPPCDQRWGVCKNTPGGYDCSCRAGYALTGVGRACADTNECAANNGGCAHICTNRFGSYACSCARRYTLAPNRLDCVDVDECLVDNGGCGPTAFFSCKNNDGYAPSCGGGFPACPNNTNSSYGDGAHVDCDGLCFDDEHCAAKPWVGDGACDRVRAGSSGTPSRNLNCSAWRYDGGDCGVGLPKNLSFAPSKCPAKSSG